MMTPRAFGVMGSYLALAIACGGKATGGDANGSGGWFATGGSGFATGGGMMATGGRMMPTGGASTGGTYPGGPSAGTGGAWPDFWNECASVQIIDSTDTLIADFECLPGPDGQKFDWFPWPNWDSWQHGGYWAYQSADEYEPSWQKWSCLPTARGGLIEPGHASTTAGYVETRVPMTDRGAVFGIWMGASATTPDTDTQISCTDASAFTGISFWILGENTGALQANAYRVELETLDTVSVHPVSPRTCVTDVNGNTTCTGTKSGACVVAACAPYIHAGTLPGAVWTQVTLKWSDFAEDPTGAVTAPLNPRELVSISFTLDTRAYGGTARFLIDDIEWVGGGPTTLPRTCPTSMGGAGGARDYSVWQTAGAAGSIAALPVCDGTPAGP